MANFGRWNLFLETAAMALGNRRFIARNFLLDEGLSTDRVSGYNDVAGTDAILTQDDWLEGHRKYLDDRIELVRPVNYIVPHSINPEALVNCPETFGRGATYSTFSSTAPEYDLIRIVDAEKMARYAPNPRQFIGSVETYLASKAEEQGQAIAATIRAWLERRDLRPVFAAFWYGIQDLMVKDAPEDWADELRDRLGLIRFDPKGGQKLPILIFRYPVGLVPKVGDPRTGSRALVVPTVLDGPWSEAFCPVPAGQGAGFAVDLSAGLDHRAQEVVHPFVRFGLQHLYRIGYIKRRVADDLSEARLAHLLWVQETCGRADYALMTDGDLLR